MVSYRKRCRAGPDDQCFTVVIVEISPPTTTRDDANSKLKKKVKWRLHVRQTCGKTAL